MNTGRLFWVGLVLSVLVVARGAVYREEAENSQEDDADDSSNDESSTDVSVAAGAQITSNNTAFVLPEIVQSNVGNNNTLVMVVGNRKPKKLTYTNEKYEVTKLVISRTNATNYNGTDCGSGSKGKGPYAYRNGTVVEGQDATEQEVQDATPQPGTAIEGTTVASDGTVTTANGCESLKPCYDDTECGTGKCMGLAVNTCNCGACMTFVTCKDDSDCGGLHGACNNNTLGGSSCDCDKGFKDNGFSGSLDAMLNFCNKKECVPGVEACFGLPCNHGNCICM